MRHKRLVIVISIVFLSSCAHVPKESVELSSTIGRDLTIVHDAHRELAKLLFARMRHDVNRFIDRVYAPYQIRAVIDSQIQLAKSNSIEDRKKSLFLAINNAFQDDASTGQQESVIKGLEMLVKEIRNDVESMREEMLDPLNEQEAIVLSSIDRAYQQIHYANSIVTGHLSSVVKVHEAQADLLESIGVERDLRKQISGEISDASNKISKLVEAAEGVESQSVNIEEDVRKLKGIIDDLKTELSNNQKEE